MAAAGFIPVVGWAGRAFKGGKAIYKTGKTVIAAEHALDAYKTGKSLDILKMTEMGAYGLVASNGFSEAVTGRDMFGNKVSEEKRKQGALEAALSLVGAGALAKHVNKGIPLAKSPHASKVEKGKKILDQVKEFKVPTNVKIRVHKTVTPDGATFPIIHADVKTTAVKDLGIVKMVSDGVRKGKSHSPNISKNHDKVAHDGYYGRKEFRTMLNNASFTPHGHKHVKAKTLEEAKRFSMTGKKAAQYLPNVNNKALEKEALLKGHIIDNGNNNYYFIYDAGKTVGYDLGTPTSWIRAEFSGGEYHGHPIAGSRLDKYLKQLGIDK